jgi:acid phosphatase (class A)
MKLTWFPRHTPVALFLLLAGCASLGGPGLSPSSPTAQIPLWKNFADKPRGYLAPGDAATAEGYLAPPPAIGSPQGQADLAIYRATRSLQNTERWALAQRDADNETPASVDKGFSCAMGATLSVEQTPILVRMLVRASSDTDGAARTAKEHYHRPRPFLAEDGPICIAREDWLVAQGSYPSGHAASGWLWALILSQLAPDRAETLMVRGRAYGESRVVCGVHYVSDIEAGRSVAAATLTRLQSDPVFVADMATAREELSRARAGGPKPAACDRQSELDQPPY